MRPSRSPSCSGRLAVILGARPHRPTPRSARRPAPTGSRCLYRSLLPSTGIVASCRDDRDCRVGYYYGDPAGSHLVRRHPGVADAAQARGDLAHRRRSPRSASTAATRARSATSSRRSGAGYPSPRRLVLAVDPRRLLLAAVEDRALVVRQVFSGREVTRIERDWAPGGVARRRRSPALHFDPDGAAVVHVAPRTRARARSASGSPSRPSPSSESPAVGQFASPYFVTRSPATLNVQRVRWAKRAPSCLVWLAT